MTVLHEISSLHGEILAANAQARLKAQKPSAPAESEEPPHPDAAAALEAHVKRIAGEIETLVDHISQDIEHNPRMATLAAFGVGLLLGFTISR
jgi:hypothetical protein